MRAAIRVGIVGAGFFGGMIARACSQHESFAVTAITDVSAESAARLAEQHGAAVADDHTALARRDDVDLIMIATPNHLHAEPAIAALGAGKHVFVEKPIAIDEDDIDVIVQSAQESTGILIVGHVMRTFPGVRAMVAEARDGGLGALLEVAGARRRVVHPPADPGDWWKLDRRRSGGELLHEIHELDLVVWAIGDDEIADSAVVRHVAGAPLMHAGHTIDTDDVTTFRTGSGIIGRHSVSTSAHRAEWWFRIAGTDATLEADFLRGTVTRFVDGVPVAVAGVFDDEESNQSLRESAERPQAYNAAGSEGPVWMRTAVVCELDEVAAAVRGTSSTLTEIPAAAARVAILARAAEARP